MTMGSNVSFIGNGALSGGAIYNAAAGHIEIGNNALFKDNTSGYDGNPYGGSDIKNYGYIQVGDGAQFVRSAYLDPWAGDAYDTGIYGMTGSTVQIGDNATFKNVVQTINTESGTYIVGDNATFDHNGSVITNFGGNHTIGDNATFKDTQFITLTNKSNNGTITVGDNAYFTGNKTRSDYMSGNGAIANNSAANTTITFGDGLVAEGNIAAGKGVVYNDKATASTIFNGSADFVNNVAQDAVVYNKGIATFNGKTTFVGNKNAESAKIKDIHNTGTLNINSEMDIDGGISGTGTINLGAGSTVNMLSEEVTGTSVLQAATINVTDGAKVALDWGDTIDASSAMGDGLRVSALYVDSSKLTDGNSFELFTNASGTLNASSLSALGIYSGSDKYNVSQSGKNLVLAKVAGAGGLAPAIDDNAQETVFSFEGDHNENIDGASLDYGNLNIMGKAGSDNNIGLTGNDGIGVGSGHRVYAENVNFEQANKGNSFDIAAGGEVSLKDSSVDKANNDGDFEMEFTQNKNINSQVSGSGNLNAKVGTGANVNWDTQYGVQQGGTMTFEGDGHIRLFDGTNGSGAGVVGDIINKTTGSSLVIDGTEIAGDGATVSGNVTNTLGSHLILTKNTSVAGTITNDGLADIKDGTFTISAGGIVDAAGTGAQGTLNIGDGTNTTTVNASTNSSPIAQNQINILDKGKLSANASKITSPNAIANAGTLELTGGTISTGVNGTGVTEINSTGTVNFADTTTKIAQDIELKAGTLQLNGGNVNHAASQTINVNAGSTLELTGGTLTTTLGGTNGNVNVTGDTTLTENIPVLAQTIGNLTIASGKTLTTTGNTELHIKNSLSNGGTIANSNNLEFTGTGDIANAGIISGTTANSKVILDGTGTGVTLTNTGTITGNNIEINANNKLITAADKVTDLDGTIVNNGTLELNGGTSATSTVTGVNATSGSGKIVIDGFVNQTGALNTTNTASDAIEVNTGKYLKINADNLGATTLNSGILDFTGGTINNNINVDGAITTLEGTVLFSGNTGVASGVDVGGRDLNLNGQTLTLADGNTLQFQYAEGIAGSKITDTNKNSQLNLSAASDLRNVTLEDIGTIKLRSSNFQLDASKVTTENPIELSNNANVTLTGASNTSSFKNAGASYVGNVIIAETMNNTGSFTNENLKINNGVTFTTNANKLATTDDVDNQGTLVLTGDATTGLLGTGITDSQGTPTGTVEVGVSGTGGTWLITNGHDITQTKVTVKQGASASSVNDLYIIAGDTITAPVEVEDNAYVANYGTIAGDVTLDAAGSTLRIADNTSSVTGSVASTGGGIDIAAKSTDASLSQIVGDLTGSYVISATSDGANTVIIDKAISGATAVMTAATSNIKITDTAYTTTTAPITVGNNSTLTLDNTTSGSATVGSTISASSSNPYDLNIVNSNSTAGTTVIGGAVTGAGDVEVKSGTATFDADVTSNTLTVDAGTTLNVNSGKTASGNLTNSGTVANSGTLSGTIDNTTAGSTLTTATSGLTNGADIKNDGTITFNDTGATGTIAQNIVKSTAGNGIVEIAGGANTVISLAAGKTITDNKLELSSGIFDATNHATTGGNIDFTAAATGLGTGLIANGGTLSVQDGKMGAINLGSVDTTTSGLNVMIDAQFTTGTIDASGITGTSDIITGAVTTAANKINVSDIKITADPVATEFRTQIADAASAGNIGLTATTLTGLSAGAGDVLLKYDNVSGFLTGGHATLKDAIISTIPTKLYVVGDGDLSAAGDLTMGGNSLSVTAEDKTIQGGGNKVALANSAQTLSISGGTGTATIQGFSTAIDNAVGGTVNLNNVTMTGNTTADVNNDGTGNLNLTGTNSIDKVTGSGTTNVNSGTTTINTSIAQDTINVGDAVTPADAALVNGGTVNATNLNVNTAGSTYTNGTGKTTTLTGKLTNKGGVANDGTLSTDTIDNQKTISGTGNLTVANGGSNAGTGASITQNNITLNGGTFANDADMTANGLLTNKATLNNSSNVSANTLDNDSVIAGTGNLTVVAGGSSDGAISQATVALTSGNFDNNANITTTGAFTNGAALDNDANISVGGAFTNTNAITTASGTGSISVAGGGSSSGAIAQKNMTLTGTTLFDNNADITLSGVLTNAAPLDNDANISADSLINTAAITSASGSGNLTVANGGSSSAAITQNNISLNGGTFNNTADMTANGLLTNKGTLNNNGAKVKANTLDNDSIIAGTGDLEVTAGGSSDGAISQATVKLTGGNFDNNANITTTGDFTTGANLDNDAAIVVGNQFVNTGVVTTASDTGTLKVANGGSSTGAITQKVVELTGGAFDNDANITTSNNFINGSALDNDAAISVGNQFINTGVVTTTNGTGTITVANGGSSTADVTQKDITFNGGAFDNTAVMTSTGTFTNNNTTITGDNGTLNVNNGSSTGKITQGTIAVAGNFDNDADMEAKTLLNVKAGANLDNDATVTAAKLTNDGVISQTAGTGNLNISGAGSYNSNSITQNNVNVKGGDFTNKTGADLMATTKLAVDAPATMVNQGNVGKSGTPVPTVQNDGTFTNDTTGVVYATLLDNNGTATNKNSIVATTVENDGTYKNDGASSSLLATTINNNAGADFENDGKVGTASDPVVTITNNGKTFTNNGTGHIVANTFNNNTDMENKVGGVIDSNVAMTNNGTATNDGQINAKGTFTNNSIVKNSAEKQGELNVVDGTNSGTMTQGDVTVAAGNTGFTNQAGGTINTEKSFVNNGILNNNSIINAINSTHDSLFANNDTYNGIDSTLNADNVANPGTMNLTRSNMIVSYQAGDITGTINIKGTTPADASKISVEGPNPNIVGNVNVGSATDTATLNFVAGNIKDVASLNLVKGSVLNVNDGGANKASVVINENDNYQGDVKLAGGNVEMRNIYLTTGDTSTTAGAELPYYEQTGGTLALNNSRLTMTDASKISGGNLIVDPSSVFTSLRNGFNVNTLQNGGLVQAVNNGYEHYGIQNHVIGSLTNEQGNYTVDLYARSNLLKSYDSFGDGNTLISAANASRNGTINVSDFVLHGDLLGKDAPIDRVILFQNMFGGSINPGDNINFTSTDKRIFTPIGSYKLSHAGQGNYMLELSEFNPAVFRGQVTKLAQYQNQLAVDDMLFTHSMVLPSFKDEDGGMSKAMMANRYAGAGDMYAPYAYTRKDGGLWFKSYGNFERLNMSHNLDIGNNGYGALIGADFGLKELSHGWKFMPTAYIAYNGAHQYFKYAGAYQNGGQAGFMGTWYKDDILLSALAYGGLYGNHMTVHNYSSEDSLGYFAGAATKAAYNWRVHKDFVIQPNLLAAYNYFGKENWHTDFGQMGMMSGMLHGINIAPGVNFIWEKDTFSAYLTVQYMYNVNQSLGGRAGNVYLPRVSMDRGYLQYGIGVNKRFSDRVSGYLQAVVRNVGRTGIGFQAGLEISLGKDKK